MKSILLLITASCFCMVHANGQLYLQSGATITTTGAAITLQDIGLQNNSTSQAVGTGKFLFNGTANSTILGTATTQFNNMEIAKTGSGVLSLGTNLNISSNLLFTSGNIDVGNYNLQLQPTATLTGESETSRLMSTGTTGTATITAALNAPQSVNLGNLGATITSAQDMGATTITRGFTSQTNGQPGAKSILRYFDITPTNNASLNATLVISYFDAELNGLNEYNMFIDKSDDGINWTPEAYTIRDLNLNFIGLINIPSFSRWTVSASDNPLPITLVSFNASCENTFTMLQWKSSTEVNAASYIVQKSANATDWTNLQTIAATNNLTGSSYSYKDVSATGNAYYRLKMVDKDGSFAYSPIFNGGCAATGNLFSVYPNPAHSYATATITVKEDTKATINVYSSDGRLMAQHAMLLQKGTTNYTLPEVATLPAGSYVVKVVMDGNSTISSKLIKL